MKKHVLLISGYHDCGLAEIYQDALEEYYDYEVTVLRDNIQIQDALQSDSADIIILNFTLAQSMVLPIVKTKFRVF